ncbi:hypothetical protein FOZ60_003971 [Perkinsus olseni]|uniref:Glutamine synthetase n=1 Tax=Perkinsus olseni TaxID=32597 RepID=A0A7J6NV73_PEROL|nr:hypothetical protein FOZ60_003971 [Perkinsus olseni]
MASNRVSAISSIVDRNRDFSYGVDTKTTKHSFGMHVFSDRVMRDSLPNSIYKKMHSTVENHEALDPSLADTVAAAMKDWAVGLGATHFTHVFYPHTGSTAEKHESFIEPSGDGTALTRFDGTSLIQGEPDASSFPNGGIRGTNEARGYTAWDVTSPAYVLEKGGTLTLCIPTAFVSWTGEAIDLKIPLLRSMQAVEDAARRVVSHFVPESEPISNITSYCGPEQEYFLVDKRLVALRPDLVICDRTLFGCVPPKSQQFDDHYFGAIPDRILKCMTETESRLYKLGVPIKCRHNEVAPGQFEIVPLFETANIASDHQHLIMQVLRNTAEKHGFQAILHEKPFAGVNGSGKHVNWSIGNTTQGNLLEPTENPGENTRFLFFIAAVIRAVDIHAGLLRGSIASASNDHRLGAQEAPPAIISIYLGDQLYDIFEQIKSATKAGESSSGDYTLETRVRRTSMSLGAKTLPSLNKDAGDRNRTSPFAFTGNKFEFRAVGSSQSLSPSLIVLNTIMAQSLAYLSGLLEERLKKGMNLEEAAKAIIGEVYKDHGRVVFNGDGYSEAWKEEAVRRGLKVLVKSPEAIEEFAAPETIKLFESCGVMSRSELMAKKNILLEIYFNRIGVEARCAYRIANTMILPACIKYQTELAENVANLKAATGMVPEFTSSRLNEISQHIECLGKAMASLKSKIDHKSDSEDPKAHARFAADEMRPAMKDLRDVVDALEQIVSDQYWPLPTYQEMLFIK